MKAVTFESPRKMVVEDKPNPKLKAPTDALLRVTTAAALIIQRRVKPSQIVSHHIAIMEAPHAYEKFDRRKGGYYQGADPV